MEDRILRDSQKTQRLANDLKKRTNNYNQILIEVNIIRLILIIKIFVLLLKYEQLQAHERDLLRQMFNLQGQSGSNVNLNDHERNQLEILQRQNARLEQERRGKFQSN
jgi:Holliday junction resolvasome RuvABC ATP-dependent DNA helicase subunit